MKTKLAEWLKRYLAAEIAGTITLSIGSALGYWLCDSKVAVACIATASELVGYYGVILYQDIRNSRRQSAYTTRKFFLVDIRRIICEFGVAEYIDTFVLRPFFMYKMPLLIKNFATGTIVGKLCADITFYVPAIAMRELQNYLEQKKRRRRQTP